MNAPAATAHRKVHHMLGNARAFSGFSVDDIAKAQEFYGKTLGVPVTERLADPSLTQLVPQRDIGSSTDGPFAEAKEQIAGFYLVQCDNIDRARQIAARIPETPGGYVEVRPVMDRNGMEM